MCAVASAQELLPFDRTKIGQPPRLFGLPLCFPLAMVFDPDGLDGIGWTGILVASAPGLAFVALSAVALLCTVVTLVRLRATERGE